MQPRNLHSWDVTAQEARAIQQRLAGQISLVDAVALTEITVVAGADNAYVKTDGGTTAYAAAVAFTFPALAPIETVIAERPVTFPYVPGLLSFRETPAVLDALRRLQPIPDVVLVDGHGYAHPRRMGFASHLGLLLDVPTIGCAKSVLVGKYEEPGPEFGAHTPLVDKGEVVGAAVRTRPSHAPLFVTVGHKISLETAIAVVLACDPDHGFLPLPTRAAHNAVTAHTKPLRRKT